MFTINLPFQDALACYQTLSQLKKKEELTSIEREFFRYAKKRANIGDDAAKVWLNMHEIEESLPDDTLPSPMSYFIKPKKSSGKSGASPVAEKKPSSKQQESDEANPLTLKEIDRLMAHLDPLVGLGKIKQQIRQILETRIIEERRRKADLKTVTNTTHHTIFTGNPGTGKTSLARLLGKVYKDSGILSRGHLVEVTRSDLIGEYIGQTEHITKKILEQASGGILFIDEAPSLYKSDSPNDFGQDVINALIKVMEDQREDLVVIVAGYPDHMAHFLNSNPGLKSRFPHHFHFENMSEDHLGDIFRDLCETYDYDLSEEAEQKVRNVLRTLKRRQESEFPNARGVRNLFEEVIRRQSERLLKQNLRARNKLRQILPEDIPTDVPVRIGNIIQLPRN